MTAWLPTGNLLPDDSLGSIWTTLQQVGENGASCNNNSTFQEYCLNCYLIETCLIPKKPQIFPTDSIYEVF